ncbi:immunity protein Imm33 domain-containing protein [Ralstonia pseudosolanacearum]|uniref:immunity protein Imm33 domain-containing protein n=1 Tax=Ralstonia pseudosolanacearum TaxID=1310165 RepID=UPI003D2F07CE
MRVQPEGYTSGWHIWAGEEFSKAPDFLYLCTHRIWCDWQGNECVNGVPSKP